MGDVRSRWARLAAPGRASDDDSPRFSGNPPAATAPGPGGLKPIGPVRRGQSGDQTGSSGPGDPGGPGSSTSWRSLTSVSSRIGRAAGALGSEGGARDESLQWSRIFSITSRCQGAGDGAVDLEHGLPGSSAGGENAVTPRCRPRLTRPRGTPRPVRRRRLPRRRRRGSAWMGPLARRGCSSRRGGSARRVSGPSA